jgi:hypothetical protein
MRLAVRRLKTHFDFKDILIDPKVSPREALDVLLDLYNNGHTAMNVTGQPRQALGFNGQLTFRVAQSLGNKGTYGEFRWNVRGPFKGSVLSVARQADTFFHEWIHAIDVGMLKRYTKGRDLVPTAGRLHAQPAEGNAGEAARVQEPESGDVPPRRCEREADAPVRRAVRRRRKSCATRKKKLDKTEIVDAERRAGARAILEGPNNFKQMAARSCVKARKALKELGRSALKSPGWSRVRRLKKMLNLLKGSATD